MRVFENPETNDDLTDDDLLPQQCAEGQVEGQDRCGFLTGSRQTTSHLIKLHVW